MGISRNPRWQQAFEHAHWGMAIGTMDFRFEKVNSAFAQMLGYSREELEGQSGEMVLPPERRPGMADRVKSVDDLRRSSFEVVLQRKDGSTFAARVDASPLKDERGNDTGRIISIVDISDEARARRELEASEARYRQLVDAMGSGVAVYRAVDDGADFVFVGFNRGAENIDNIERKSVVGRRLTEVFPAIKEFGLLEVLRRVHRTGKPEHFPLAWYDDKRISGWRDNYVYRLSSGELGAVYEDRTDERAAAAALEDAKRALEESAAKYQLLFENDPNAILLVDAQTLRVVEANPAATRLYGYTLEEFRRLSAPDLSAEPQETVRTISALKDGEVGRVSARKHRRKDGSVFFAELMGSLFEALGRQVNCTIVRDRTAELAQSRTMENSRLALERLSRHLQQSVEKERTRLAQEIHDDLGQTLTALSLGLQSLLDRVKDRESGDLSGDELLTLSNRALGAVRRIASGLRPRMLDHLGLVPALEWLCEDFSEWSGVDTRISSSHQEVELEPDVATAVFRVCQEALTNVARHADATTVEVEFEQEEDGLVLRVRDNGRGMSAETNSDPDSMGLTGMRQRARAIGGELAIDTIPDQATTVSMLVPGGGRGGEK